MLDILRSMPLIYGLIICGACFYLMVHQRKKSFSLENMPFWQIALMLGLLTFVMAMGFTSSGHGWGDDFSEYIAQARALVDGNVSDWMEHNVFIIEHSQHGMGAAVYPWGTAVLLAPLYSIFGLNFTVFKIFESLCLAGSAICLLVFYHRRFNRTEAVVLTLFTSVNPWVLRWADDVSSHVPCMFFILLTFVVLDAYVKQNKRGFGRALLIGLLIFFSIQLRSVSLSVLLALFFVDLRYLCSLFERRNELSGRKWAKEIGIGVTPYVIFLVGTIGMKFIIPQAGGTYQSYFDVSAETILGNLVSYVEIFGLFFGDVLRPYFDGGLFFTICSIGLWGFGIYGIFLKRKDELYYGLYVFATMAVLLVFVGTQLTLYVLTVFPILLMFAWIGVKQAVQGGMRTVVQAFAAGILSAMVVWNLYAIGNIQSGRNIINTAYAEESMELYDYINNTIDDDEIIYFFKPRALYLNTDNYTYWCDPEEDQWMLGEYLILYAFDPEYENVKGYVNEGGYTLVFDNSTYQLYQNEKN